MTRISRPWSKLCAALLVVTFVAAACGGDDDATAPTTTGGPGTEAPETTEGSSETTDAPAATPAAPETRPPDPVDEIVRGGSLTLAIDGEAACYLPSGCSVSYGPGAARWAVLEQLARPAATSSGYELVLAESIEPNEDFTQFTVTLRDDIVWSDGTPVTAQEIKDLFDDYVLAEDSTLSGNVASIESTEVIDDRSVAFNLVAPDAPFPVGFTNIPIWRPDPGLDNNSLPIGTGPFKFENWERDVALHLVRNENYWQSDEAGNQLPYLDEVTVVPIVSAETRVTAIETGEVDITISVDPLVTANMRDVTEVLGVPLNAGGGLFFNNSHPPADDLRVRAGLSYATNKDDIMGAIGGGDHRTQYYVPDSPWYTPEATEIAPGFDPDRGRELIEEYINDPERSDGKAPGEPLEIDIAQVQGFVTAGLIAQVAQQNWQDIGVTVTITPKDQATLIGDAISGNFIVNYFQWATPHPYSLLVRNYGPWPETPSNYTHFNSQEIWDIVGQMAVASTEEEMNELIHQSNIVLAEGVPLIWLHSTMVAWGVSEEVGNIELLPGNGFLEWPTLSRAG